MNKTAIIVSGGTLDFEFVQDIYLSRKWDYRIAVDQGLQFFMRQDLLPTHIVGDFDSIGGRTVQHYAQCREVEILEYDPVKDASDTEIGIRLAIELGVKELWILGGTGTRLDHTLANIQCLKIAKDAGVRCYLLDLNNRISLIDSSTVLKKQEAYGTYFSLFSLGRVVENLCIKGAVYELEHYQLLPYDSRCVSNEYKEDTVQISYTEGNLILMETRD